LLNLGRSFSAVGKKSSIQKIFNYHLPNEIRIWANYKLPVKKFQRQFFATNRSETLLKSSLVRKLCQTRLSQPTDDTN